MSKTYGLMADLHLHAWSSFSTTTTTGQNSRLVGLLSEIERCAVETKAAGGNIVVMAGDVFHVRGSVAPEVLNAVRDSMKKISFECGTYFVILAGNHDLSGKNSERLGSAVTALENNQCGVINYPNYDPCGGVGLQLVMIPWFEKIDELKTAIEATATSDRSYCDLILHAPIDGVIKGLPFHGLSPEYLAGLGFRRVFSGHYHNHKHFEGGVYSIGALAHHTWSDIGTKAGFLIVTEEDVTWRKSHLPEFIDLAQLVDLTPEEIPYLVDGNFVRVKVESSKMKDIEDARQELLAMGAIAVTVQASPKPPAREGVEGSRTASAESLEVSVTNYIKTLKSPLSDEIEKAALDILASSTAVGD